MWINDSSVKSNGGAIQVWVQVRGAGIDGGGWGGIGAWGQCHLDKGHQPQGSQTPASGLAKTVPEPYGKWLEGFDSPYVHSNRRTGRPTKA
ncbi:MAG: hypothetical protein HDQ97_01025 [Lachnospiraceae bacterium]|nr:hypothetical protein [Lachnospiraceae bacterium]